MRDIGDDGFIFIVFSLFKNRLTLLCEIFFSSYVRNEH